MIPGSHWKPNVLNKTRVFIAENLTVIEAKLRVQQTSLKLAEIRGKRAPLFKTHKFLLDKATSKELT